MAAAPLALSSISERHRADVDFLTAANDDLLSGGDALAPHEGAVGAATILDEELARYLFQEGVAA